MGTAQLQGSLWGARSRDYASFVEGQFARVYERILDETGVGPETRYLDVGCGPGLPSHLAARRGARVAGLDAAEASIAIARGRTPTGDFQVGEMEKLPWSDGSFDVVTGFNSFQFASNLVNALAEARRVAVPGGRVAMLFWGRDEDVEILTTIIAVSRLLPPSPNHGGGPPLSTPGRVEALMEEAGLTPQSSNEMDWVSEYPDLETALRGYRSVGGVVAAVQQVGAEAVSRAIADSLAPFRTSEGGYRQRNRLRYVIASKP